jgi:hypothetical protein
VERAVRVGPTAARGRAYGLASEFNGAGAQQGSLYPPTATHRQRFALISAALRRAEAELARLEALINTIQ